MNFLQQVGSTIRTLRKARKWSQSELGRQVGLPQSAIHYIEYGKDTYLGSYKKIADALEIPISRLFSQPATPEHIINMLQKLQELAGQQQEIYKEIEQVLSDYRRKHEYKD